MNCISGKKLFLLLTVCFCGVCLVGITFVHALEPPPSGNIENLKKEGKFANSLQFARKIGNHKISKQLAARVTAKIKRAFLRAQGLPSNEVDRLAPLPPPSWQGMPTTGNVRILALLIEFADYPSSIAQPTIDSMLFGAGNQSYFPLESLTNYYNRSSYGLLNIQGTTLGWYRTPYNRSAIEETDSGRENLIKEALNSFDSTHDFSQYDNDGDGEIDYFLVMWTGPVGDWATFWWGYQTGWADSSYTLDGKQLGSYSWQWESDRPNVVIHETGHALGLPDYYDYEPGTGPEGGVGGIDMMDANQGDHNCFSKWMLDWITPIVHANGTQSITLSDSASSNQAVLIWPGIGLGDIWSEFYMVQNRQNIQNDISNFQMDGLAIWHVDATLEGGDFKFDNSYTDHKLLRLMEADGLEHIESGGFFDNNDLYTPNTRFGPDTIPSSAKYDSSESCVSVRNIIDYDTTPGATISAQFSVECNTPPEANAGGPYIAECQGAENVFVLDGTGSKDPNNDPLTYQWSTQCPGAVIENPDSAVTNMRINGLEGCGLSCSVSLQVTDSRGAVNSSTATLSLIDSLNPIISCPNDLTVECDQSVTPDATGFASATDKCVVNSRVSSSDKITAGYSFRTIHREWVAMDNCQNQSSCTQKIKVVDTTAPVIECNTPPTITPWDTPVSFQATAVDNCSKNSYVKIYSYDCDGPRKHHNKRKSCKVRLKGNTAKIIRTGKPGTNITWKGIAVDKSGNTRKFTCGVKVVKHKRKH